MTDRSRIVLFKRRDDLPSQRLRDECPTYKVASEILVGAADLGCSGDIFDFIWSICQREADLHVGKSGEGA